MAGCDLAPSGSWRDWAVLLMNTVAGLLLCSVGAHADVPDALRAYHYRRGVGAPRNLIEAWAWFDRLAEAGDSRAAVERDWLGLAGLNEDTMAQARVRSAALARELEAAPIMAELEYFWGESHWP